MPALRSDLLKKGASRTPARAMRNGAGFSDTDLEKPLVGVGNTWTQVTLCNALLRVRAERALDRDRDVARPPTVASEESAPVEGSASGGQSHGQ